MRNKSAHLQESAVQVAPHSEPWRAMPDEPAFKKLMPEGQQAEMNDDAGVSRIGDSRFTLYQQSGGRPID